MNTTKQTTLTYEEALAYLNRAVEEKGADYIYQPPLLDSPTCFYFGPQDTTQKGCIIGHVLAYMGYTYEDLSKAAERQGGTATGMNANSAFTVLHTLDIKVDETTLALLSRAQRYQDERVPWGLAVQKAVRETRAVGGVSW